MLQGKSTYSFDQRIEQPKFRLPQRHSDFAKRLIAESAFYRTATVDHPTGYLLQGVKSPVNLGELNSLHEDGAPVVITPADVSWLKPDECYVVSDVSFEQLSERRNWRRYASTLELISGLRNPSLDHGANVRVTMHSRLVQPILDVTLLFVGLPLVMANRGRSIYVGVALCMSVVFGRDLLILCCHSLGNSYLISPTFAAWCPLLVMVPAAIFMYDGLRR